ncbi:hypothetical protein [Thiolapillus sp.]|uniref:hypothetical protein n=1 Tax=Thiolapillus sp. TaxID=2017437 RepID=UPI0025F740B8|nr:hypothetical protein [Thiolapillus sp.]
MRVILILLLSLPVVASAKDAPAPNDDRIISSWQVVHPVATGVMSALTLGLWPSDFGSDAKENPAALSMNAGYGPVAFSYVKQSALPIFRTTRNIVWGMLFVLAGFLVVNRLKQRRTACPN